MSSLLAALNFTRVRLSRSSALSAFVVGALFVVLWSFLEKSWHPATATDRALLSGVYGVLLPLLAFFVTGSATENRSLSAGLMPLARHGADNYWAALGLFIASSAALVVLAVPLCALCVLLTRGLGDAHLVQDLALSSWVCTLGAFAYAAFLTAASSFGARGPAWALGVDWLLGSHSSLVAVAWPRGHLRNLAGESPLAGLSQPEATSALLGLSAAYLLISLWRSPR